MKAIQRVGLTIGIIIVIVLFFYGIARTITNLTGYSVSEHSKEEIELFAKCLTDGGAVLYMSGECRYCEAQKEIFGEGIKYIKIINCVEELEMCAKKEILFVSVPTWEIDGKLFYGKFSLDKLAQMSGCRI